MRPSQSNRGSSKLYSRTKRSSRNSNKHSSLLWYGVNLTEDLVNDIVELRDLVYQVGIATYPIKVTNSLA